MAPPSLAALDAALEECANTHPCRSTGTGRRSRGFAEHQPGLSHRQFSPVVRRSGQTELQTNGAGLVQRHRPRPRSDPCSQVYAPPADRPASSSPWVKDPVDGHMVRASWTPGSGDSDTPLLDEMHESLFGAPEEVRRRRMDLAAEAELAESLEREREAAAQPGLTEAEEACTVRPARARLSRVGRQNIQPGAVAEESTPGLLLTTFFPHGPGQVRAAAKRRSSCRGPTWVRRNAGDVGALAAR